MKCNRCGHEQENDFIFCPTCGFETPTAPLYDEHNTRVSSNPAFHHLSNAFKDSLFLVFCILMTASCGISLVSGESFDIINILLTIFSWLTFTSAKSGTLDSSKIKNISGTVYANFIIACITSALLLIGAVMMFVSIGFINAGGDFRDVFDEETIKQLSFFGLDNFNVLLAIMIACMVLVAIIHLIIAVLGIRIIHKFVQSLYQSVDAGCISFINCRAAGNWLIFFGIASFFYSSPTAFSSEGYGVVAALVAQACQTAAMIVLGLFVKKHFSEFE